MKIQRSSQRREIWGKSYLAKFIRPSLTTIFTLHFSCISTYNTIITSDEDEDGADADHGCIFYIIRQWLGKDLELTRLVKTTVYPLLGKYKNFREEYTPIVPSPAFIYITEGFGCFELCL